MPLKFKNKLLDIQENHVVSSVSYVRFLGRLNGQQRTYVTLIGLGDLLKTPSMNIRHLLCQTIANTYNEEPGAFIIGGIPMKITLQEVENIMGLP
jgi:hypothetical protein